MQKPDPNGVHALWREESQDTITAPPKKPSRAIPIFILIAVMALLIGLFLGVVFWARPDPSPMFVPVWIDNYESLVVSPVGWSPQDQKAIGSKTFFQRELTEGYSAQKRYKFLDLLASLKDVSRHCVIYVSGQGILGPDDRVEIVFADSNPVDPKTRVPLATILETLNECPSSRKLLILDISHGFADTRIGSPSADVASAIPKEIETANVRNLLVLTSCSPGQVSHSSETLGRSIFGHYLEQGLTGSANGFGQAGKRDGRVSAKELAAFVAVRVDRWSRQNRTTRQTPQLLGDGFDFDLRAFEPRDEPKRDLQSLTKGEETPEEAPTVKSETKYPKWLEDRWKSVGQLFDSGQYRRVPYTFRYLRSMVLRAERRWRAGVEPALIQEREIGLFDKAAGGIDDRARLSFPRFHSLALATQDGVEENGFRAKLDDYFVQINELDRTPAKDVAKAKEKLTTEFFKAVREAPFASVANAVLARVASDENLTAEQIQLYDSIILATGVGRQPKFAEVLLLRELADAARANQKLLRSPEATHALLQTTQTAEAAGSSILAYPWTREILQAASQDRHDGELRFWAVGYVDEADAFAALRAAATQYATAAASADIIEDAWKTIDEATVILPAYVRYLMHHRENDPDWFAAIEESSALYNQLLTPTSTPLKVGARIKEIRRSTGRVRQQMETLMEAFEKTRLQQLVVASKLPRAEIVTLQEINALLETSLVPTDMRTELWQAAYKLDAKFHNATAEIDFDDDVAEENTAEVVPYAPEKAQTEMAIQTRRRVEHAIALFRLGGFKSGPLFQLQSLKNKAFRKDAKQSDRNKLNAELVAAWTKDLRDQYDEEFSPAGRDRLLRIAPPLLGTIGLGVAGPSDAVQALTAKAKGLWGWLAEDFRYRARDYRGSGLRTDTVLTLGNFYATASGAYQYVSSPTTYPRIQFTQPKVTPRLTTAKPQGTTALGLQVYDYEEKLGPQNIPVQVLLADKLWLRVVPSPSLLNQLRRDRIDPTTFLTETQLQVNRTASTETTAIPPPRGFLVAARLKGRTFHRRVNVPLESGDERIEVVLSSNLAEPDPAVSAIRLRPANIQERFYVHLYNPGRKPRAVIVQALRGNKVIEGGASKLIVPPQKSQRVPFKGEKLNTKKGLPLLNDPLQIRVIDGLDKTTVIANFVIPVAIASPREYVSVSNIGFDPPDERNNFQNQFSVTLQTLNSRQGPDIPIELRLPPNRIPGFVAAKDGSFKSTLPAKVGKEPTPATLYARNILLAPAQELDGYTYIDVDGYERAFVYKTTFAREGEPLTPQADLQPAVHFETQDYVLTNPKFKLLVGVDNPPANAQLEVEIGRGKGNRFQRDIQKLFSRPKDKRIGFLLDEATGGLLFQASVDDWEVVLDTSRVLGTRTIRARLLDDAKNVIYKTSQTITFDNTPPERTRFTFVPPKAQKEKSILVRAFTQDPESGIAKVGFFVGKLKDGKIPDEDKVVYGQPVNKEKTKWTAELVMPEKVGLKDVTVVASNRVGLASNNTAKVLVTLTDPAKTGPGKIAGKVTQGTIAQPNLQVILYNKEGKAIAETKTDKEGNYEFADLKPDKYFIRARNRATQRGASQNVEVRANETTQVDLSLKLYFR
ncbi:MAG: carboxypeptidase regulatory-like domain-containing protein [Gemmataceae bacterium]